MYKVVPMVGEARPGPCERKEALRSSHPGTYHSAVTFNKSVFE